MVRNKPIHFLVDIGATCSTLDSKVPRESSNIVTVTRVIRKLQKQAFFQPQECQLGEQKIVHSFLYMPVHPITLLGQHLLCKLHAKNNFFFWKAATMYTGPTGTCSPVPGAPYLPERSQRQTLPTWNQWTLFGPVWADGSPDKAFNVQPIKVNCKEGSWIPWKKQTVPTHKGNFRGDSDNTAQVLKIRTKLVMLASW